MRRVRPKGMTEAEVFAWFMPGDPPPAPSLTEGCWDWMGSTTEFGHGLFWMHKTPVRAHRVAYQIYRGAIPPGQCILHWCDRPICVQPAHLHLGTRPDNTREMVERGRAPGGMKSGNAKLTDDNVLWIRAQTTLTQQEMASIFGVDQSTIALIRQRKTWKHIH